MALWIIGVLVAVSSASPKGNDDHNDSEGRSSLTVLTKTVEQKVVNLGAQGLSQGDMRVVNAPLYNETGKEKVGRLDLFCVVTDPADEPSEKAHMAQCSFTYTLAGGEISAQGVDAFPELPGRPSRSVDALERVMNLLRNGLLMRKTGGQRRTELTETFAFLCGFPAEFITRSKRGHGREFCDGAQ